MSEEQTGARPPFWQLGADSEVVAFSQDSEYFVAIIGFSISDGSILEIGVARPEKRFPVVRFLLHYCSYLSAAVEGGPYKLTVNKTDSSVELLGTGSCGELRIVAASLRRGGISYFIPPPQDTSP